jgi:phospholipase/carboxylesterase
MPVECSPNAHFIHWQSSAHLDRALVDSRHPDVPEVRLLATLSGPHRPPQSGGTPKSLVVLLHGRGSNGDDLIGLADMMADDFPDTTFHSPNAPIEVGGFGYMWFPMDAPGGRAQALHEIEPLVNGFVDDLLKEYSLPSSRCVLLGFSQGCILSLHIGPRRSEQLAGVVGLSGGLHTGDTLREEMASKPPFVLIHGADDQVIDAGQTEVAGRTLDDVGIPVSVHIIPGLAHGIDQRALDIATGFMKRVLPNDPA